MFLEHQIKSAATLIERHPIGDDSIGGEAYKFIKVNDDYRFISTWINHSDVVANSETATAAGMIAVSPDSWILIDNYSITLKVRCAFEEVEPQLTELLKRPGKNGV